MEVVHPSLKKLLTNLFELFRALIYRNRSKDCFLGVKKEKMSERLTSMVNIIKQKITIDNLKDENKSLSSKLKHFKNMFYTLGNKK